MTTVGLVSSARSDVSFYLPLMRALEAHPAFELRVIATGMHLVREFGLTVRQIEDAGFRVHERVESLAGTDSPEGVASSMGRGVTEFSRLFARWRPDLLLVFGDRFDMFPAALAALPFRIPVAHIAGVDITEGAMDDALRHALTKLSHLHFVSLEAHRERIVRMGEEPWRVVVCGSLALDTLKNLTLWTPAETAERFHLDLTRPAALVTYHTVTLEYEQTGTQITNLLTALDEAGVQCLFTYPNADMGYRQVIRAIERFCDGRADRRVIVNAGQVEYFSLLQTVSVMVGNSSSGLVEAPSFKLPVVNIGARQAGRIRVANVISCGDGVEDVAEALRRALSPEFRATLHDLRNPYGDGHAAERLVERLAVLCHRSGLLHKKFMDGVARVALEEAVR